MSSELEVASVYLTAGPRKILSMGQMSPLAVPKEKDTILILVKFQVLLRKELFMTFSSHWHKHWYSNIQLVCLFNMYIALSKSLSFVLDKAILSLLNVFLLFSRLLF